MESMCFAVRQGEILNTRTDDDIRPTIKQFA